MKARQKDFTIIPNKLINDKRLTAFEKIVYAAIASHFPNSFPGVRRIQTMTSISQPTIVKAINKLINFEYLAKTKFGRGFKYSIAKPHLAVDTNDDSPPLNPVKRTAKPRLAVPLNQVVHNNIKLTRTTNKISSFSNFEEISDEELSPEESIKKAKAFVELLSKASLKDL